MSGEKQLPSREDVARPFSEAEAFKHARRLYHDLITDTIPPAASLIVADREMKIFRPACELQFAGLSMLSGRHFPKPQAVVVSLCCFTVDHLVSGWTSACSGQPRVASTLVRAAVEASIFAMAAHEDYPAFERVWTTPKGTGGAVLRSLKRVPKSTRVLVEEAWKMVVPLGHASVVPVMSARGTFLDGAKQAIGISFAGQFAGPLDAGLLRSLVNLYCLASIVAVDAMNISLQPMFTETEQWRGLYRKLTATLEERMPIPKHLEPYMDQILEMRRRSAGGSA
jgi:hypothetical protein